MPKTADEIINSLPDFMKRNYEQNFTGKQVQSSAPVTETRHGALGIAALERAETAEREQAPAKKPFTGRILPGIFCDRGDELSVWRNGPEIAIQLRCRSGDTYHGGLVPALNAEGGFDLAYADEADLAFVRHTIADVVTEAKLAGVTREGEERPRLSADDFNYCHFATALWTNQSRTGAAVHRAFLVFTWGQAGGNWYPKDAILFDGDKLRTFALSRPSGGTVRSPQWKGTAK
jgi:hypothetical protein